MQSLGPEQRQLLHTQRPYASTWSHRHRRPKSCLVHRRLATSSSGRLPTSTPRGSHPSKQTLALRLALQPNHWVQRQLLQQRDPELKKYCSSPNELLHQVL